MRSIKIASTADIVLIRELSQKIWPQTYIPIIGVQQVHYMLELFYSQEALKKQMEESGHYFILCYEDLEPVAFASYSEIEPLIYKLHKIYTLPEWQGKRIGQYMLRYIVADLKSRGAAALRLNVNRHNYPAKSFYEKTGFKHFKEEDIDIGNGFFMNDHVLELPI